MRVVAIIQARMGSTRLPGKVLMDLAGRTMLEHVAERALRAPGIDDVVIATSDQPADDGIAALAKRRGLKVFRGSEADVLARYHGAAVANRADAVVRITADCPLLDPDVVGQVVARLRQGDVDYVNNTTPPTFPDGLDCEAFTFEALDQAFREARLPSQREHVTPFLWGQPERYRTAVLRSPVDLSAHRWTVDEPQDLLFVRAVMSRLAARSMRHAEVLALLRAEPALATLNGSLQRNEGYAKSLARETGRNE